LIEDFPNLTSRLLQDVGGTIPGRGVLGDFCKALTESFGQRNNFIVIEVSIVRNFCQAFI
jgi:hypothetical protein